MILKLGQRNFVYVDLKKLCDYSHTIVFLLDISREGKTFVLKTQIKNQKCTIFK